MLHGEEYAGEIDGDHFVPRRSLDIGGEIAVALDAGIVEGGMKPAMRLDRGLDHAAAIGGLADIGLDEDRRAAAIADHLGRYLAILVAAIDHGEASAFSAEGQRGRAPDAGRGAAH